MVEFKTEYYTPMDRGYHERVELEPVRSTANIEQPILPIAQLGQTVPEHDPTGRFKNILQNVQAAIRGGTGNLQLVFQTPIESAIGGRPKAYGEEVRQAIKEVALANEVAITGMEMPTSLTNMSGWDAQRGIVDEEKRQRDLDEVKEMVRFAAEVAQGGGVDIVSWEYDRPIHRANWLDKKSRDAFAGLIKQEKEKEILHFVDKRSGAITQIPIREGIPMFVKSGTWATIPFDGTPEVWDYEKFKAFAQHELKKEGVTPDEVAQSVKNHFLDEQLNMAKAQASYYLERLRGTERQIGQITERLAMPGLAAGEKAALGKALKEYEEIAANEKIGIQEQKRVQLQFEERKKNLLPMEGFVLEKSAQSFSEAGIAAMQMQDKLGPKQIKKDLYVGPEIGWPQFYGSHPKEFVETIMRAREQMIDVLTDPKRCKTFGFDRPLRSSQAEEEARRHIKGTFDTSHMGMWLQNFHPEMPWHKRLKEFKKWYGEQIDWLANENKKHDIIGAIQAVDSAGAGHGHLPPGQGILPVKDAINTLREKGGFNGYVVSEGHEEEKFGEGRILLKSWQHFNAPISSGYGPGMPVKRWGEVQHGYFGRTYSPMMMFGAYAPSNEFKLWSEIPLE